MNLAALTFFSVIWLHTQWIPEMFPADTFNYCSIMLLLLLSLFCETLLPTPRPSGTCKRGRCYAVFTLMNLPTISRCHAVFTWVNLQARCRGHVCFVLTELAQMQRRCYAMCIVVQHWKLQIRQKNNAKSCESTDASNVHFLLQITYEGHHHWKCDVAFARENTIKACFF